MKIRGELLSATQRFEFENSKKVRDVRAVSETEEYRNIRRCIDIFRASFGKLIVQNSCLAKKLYKLFTAILKLSDHLRYITLSGLRVEQESNLKTADH